MAENQIVKKDKEFKHFITTVGVKNRISNIIGNNVNNFVTTAISLVSKNPALNECDNNSLINALLQVYDLKLNPNPQLGYAYIIPFKNKKKGTVEAQLQVGYKGLIQLALRTGEYADMDVITVNADDVLVYNSFGSVNGLKKGAGSNEVIGYLAYFEMTNGFKKAVYMSKDEVELHADTYSQAFDLKTYRDLKTGKIPKNELWKYSSFWYKDFDSMAQKTVLKKLLNKWGLLDSKIEEVLYNEDIKQVEEEPAVYDFEVVEQETNHNPVLESKAEPFTPKVEESVLVAEPEF